MTASVSKVQLFQMCPYVFMDPSVSPFVLEITLGNLTELAEDILVLCNCLAECCPHSLMWREVFLSIN